MSVANYNEQLICLVTRCSICCCVHVVSAADEKPPHVEAGNDMESVARAMDLTGRAWMGDSEADGCLGCSFSWHILK